LRAIIDHHNGHRARPGLAAGVDVHRVVGPSRAPLCIAVSAEWRLPWVDTER
jgi:hypothetical protein